tara:strand:+ start:478 stop:591 length:114 start_codon:yes stop_codon:yes gene_type:complete
MTENSDSLKAGKIREKKKENLIANLCIHVLYEKLYVK